MKCQHNVTSWNTPCDQTIRDAFFGSIVLNPDLTIANVNMDERSRNTFDFVPADTQYLIMIMFLIHNHFHFDVN